MNSFKELPLWQKILAFVLGLFAILWLSYSYIYGPKIQEIRQLKAKLKNLDLQLKAYVGDKVVLKKGQEVKEELQKQLDEVLRKIPTEQEIPFLLNAFFINMGKGLDISYKTIAPEKAVSEGSYKRVPIRVEFTSQYADLNSYLLQLKKLPTTMRVDDIVINRLGGDPPKLEVGMLLSAFVMPSGQKAKQEEKENLPSYYSDPFAEESSVEVFSRPAAKKQASSGLQLQGIWEGKKTKVFINGKMLGVGDTISGYQVISITDKKVNLNKGAKKLVLTMGETR